MPLFTSLSPALQTAAGALAGGVTSAAYFGALVVNVRWFTCGAIGIAALMQFVRFALLSLVLYGLARLGAAALLSGLAMLVAVRHAMVRHTGWAR
jgi:hypothetical protein